MLLMVAGKQALNAVMRFVIELLVSSFRWFISLLANVWSTKT